MKIFYQTNDNDCGIAVTQTLIKYFFKEDVGKEELYQESNLKDEGLSILDLEILNEKYGIKLESYSMDFEEFKEYEISDPFLLVINRSGEQHYTVAKKRNKKVILFDPSLGKVILPIEEVRPIWLDIFIRVTPQKERGKLRAGNFAREGRDNYRIFSLFLVNVTVVLLSILNSYLIKYGINHVFSNRDFSNLIKVLFLSILCHLIFYFGELVESWLVFKHRVRYSTDLYSRLMDALKFKRNSYFRKMGRDQFLILKEHIDCVASYHAEYINRRYLSIFTLFLVSLFFLHMSPYFALLIVFSGAVQVLFWKLIRNAYHRYLPKLNELQNRGKRFLYFLERFIHAESNVDKLCSLVDQSKRNWEEEMDHQREFFLRQIMYSKLNSCLNHVLYVVVFFLVAYYIYTGNLNFGTIMISHFLYFHLSKAFGNLVGYYGFKTKYSYSRQIYSQILNVDSFERTSNTISPPKVISIRNLFYASRGKIVFRDLNLEILPGTLILGPSGCGKTVLYRLMVNKLSPSLPSIYFDDICVSEMDPSSFRDLCIYQVSDSYICPDALVFRDLDGVCENLKKHILHICNLMSIDLSGPVSNPENLSSGQRQLINILFLLKYRNKVLFLDEIASHINEEARILVYKHLISHLASNNFVVCSEHSSDIMPFFPHHINLCSR